MLPRGGVRSILLSGSAFLDRAFRVTLGRDADQVGLDFYCGLLRQGVRRPESEVR